MCVTRRPASARAHTSCPFCPGTPQRAVPLLSTRVQLPLALPTSVLSASSRSLKTALSFSMNPLQPESTNSCSPSSSEAPSELPKLKNPCFSGPLLVPLDCPILLLQSLARWLLVLHLKHTLFSFDLQSLAMFPSFWHLKHVIFLLLLPPLEWKAVEATSLPGYALVLAKLMMSCFISS